MNQHHAQPFIRIQFFSLLAALLVAGTAIGDGKAGTGGISGRVFLDENADTYLRDCDCDCGLEAIKIRLYKERCAGLIIQTVKSDEEGYYHFKGLEPGEYCVTPDIKMMCDGFQATKPITQKVRVRAGEVVEAEWFAFDHWLDRNE